MNNCEFLRGCDCTARNGSLLTPAPPPHQPGRPKSCPECILNCPLIPACPPSTTLCTHAQLVSNILKCPACNPLAGCTIGCPCIGCYGFVYDPPENPPQDGGQAGCPICVQSCPPLPFCPLQRQCTLEQLNTYIPRCPPCVGTDSCQEPGCNCFDAGGNQLTPPRYPPQPPRPNGCPICDPDCPPPIPCPPPVQCTAEQLETYVPVVG